ncbi:hypothetical protein GGR54DRAFT_582155 [Hypoxylon sp. NC1633]|nr:hypothetical protein GGR54DRAFT_582155 [Hypoxylon sp. NC1633]
MDDSLSSPDPLGDDPPTSVHSYARRTTNNKFARRDFSSLSVPKSTSRMTSPTRKSPRKQTFELDVGNEHSPQKILVTVEAEEALRRGINRTLFPPSSPTRSDRHQDTITTTIPLNDEIHNESTPKRRGRPRRTSNGTPMPRGKKRAGTPIQKATRQTRRKGDPEADASMSADTPTRALTDSAMPKVRGRARKTPKTTTTAQVVPSSQLSTNTTKRKRGRPRKALMPEEVAILADMGDQSSVSVANTDISQPTQEPSELDPVSDKSRDEEGRQAVANDGETFMDYWERESERTPTPANTSYLHGTQSIPQDPVSSTIPDQEESPDYEDIGVDDDYPGMMEAHSDIESDLGDFEGVPHNGQDTLAHASDFSMIAVESLPSFQANRSAFPSDPQEMGDETNLIINQTIESLRRSTQTETDYQSPAQLDEDDLPEDIDEEEERERSNIRGGSLAQSSDHSLLGPRRSPRRQKPVPLSRQVLRGKAPHTDDSFSSIPDSILQAATPGHGPVKPSSAHTQQEDASVMYDDSFSEIPEAILEAATPKPVARTRNQTEESRAETPSRVGSANRSTGPNLGSSRLPTPDDTSSSNAGSKKAQEDDMVSSTRPRLITDLSSNLGIRSSPPIVNRPRAMDFGPSRLDQEIGNTPGLQHSSPQLPKSLEPPSISRPSLSPIVRVGRTLQNVMSDRSSPEGREGSLGSPFRGSSNNDPPQPFTSDQSGQSSMPESPTPANYNTSTQLSRRSSFNPNPTFTQDTRSNFSRGQPSAQDDIIGDLSDPFGPDMPDYSETEALRRSAYNNNNNNKESRSGFIPSLASSTRAVQSSDDMGWDADGDDRQEEVNQQQESHLGHSHNSSIFATRGSNTNLAAAEASGSEMSEELEQMAEEEDIGGNSDYEENDADIWDIEASRPTPRRPEPARIVPQPQGPPPRRSKIPSPWRRSNRRLIYREDIASPSQIEIEESPQSEAEDIPTTRPRPRPSDAQSTARGKESEPTAVTEPSFRQPERQILRARPPIQENPAEPAEVSEYSMIAKETENTPATQKKTAPAKSGLLGKFDFLSGFFSSPAILPQKAPEDRRVDGNQGVEKVSQRTFQKPPPNEVEKPQPPPQQSLWSTGLFPSMPQRESSQPDPERRTDSLSPAPAMQSDDTVLDTYERTSLSPALSNSPEPNPPQSPQPSTPERQIFPPIEQKRNFTPRPGQSGLSLFRRGPSVTSSQLDHDGHQPPSGEQQESSLMTDGTEYERVPPREKPSQWDKTLSPSKSSFRSPLKPSTPGRVVAFKQSLLSPTAQAQARAEKQNSIRNGGILSQGPLLQPILESRENQPARPATLARVAPRDAKTVPSATTIAAPKLVPNHKPNATSLSSAAAPLQQKRRQQLPSRSTTAVEDASAYDTATKPLSQTNWTRQHWLRLDEMLQLCRHDPAQFAQQFPPPPPPPRSRRPSPSSSTLLGKEVSAQGESLILEPWHLEIIDAFRREVGGWDDRVMARRLFALIIGEEWRRKGLVRRGGGAARTQRERQREREWEEAA